MAEDNDKPNKRHASGSPTKEETNKKLKVDPGDMTLSELYVLMTTQIQSVTSSVTERFDQLERSITNNVIDAIAVNIAKKIKESVDLAISEKLATFKEEIQQDISKLAADFENAPRTNVGVDARNLNFVVYNLIESSTENVERKINSMLREGMKLNMSVISAKRLVSRNNNIPGIIIATCKDAKDKESIMKAKPELRRSRNFSDVRISHDKAPEQRANEANLRIILREIGEDKYELRGNRLVFKGPRPGIGEENNRHSRAPRQSQAGDGDDTRIQQQAIASTSVSPKRPTPQRSPSPPVQQRKHTNEWQQQGRRRTHYKDNSNGGGRNTGRRW